MTVREIMKYIESEYRIINNTPCEICGGEYFADDLSIKIIEDEPYDVCECICSNCGNERVFEFLAPFISESSFKKLKHKLN